MADALASRQRIGGIGHVTLRLDSRLRALGVDVSSPVTRLDRPLRPCLDPRHHGAHVVGRVQARQQRTDVCEPGRIRRGARPRGGEGQAGPKELCLGHGGGVQPGIGTLGVRRRGRISLSHPGGASRLVTVAGGALEKWAHQLRCVAVETMVPRPGAT